MSNLYLKPVHEKIEDDDTVVAVNFLGYNGKSKTYYYMMTIEDSAMLVFSPFFDNYYVQTDFLSQIHSVEIIGKVKDVTLDPKINYKKLQPLFKINGLKVIKAYTEQQKPDVEKFLPNVTLGYEDNQYISLDFDFKFLETTPGKYAPHYQIMNKTTGELLGYYRSAADLYKDLDNSQIV